MDCAERHTSPPAMSTASDRQPKAISLQFFAWTRAEPLFAFDLAVERMAAARRALDESGTGILLTGRSEGFVCGRPDIDETIRRLRAYADTALVQSHPRALSDFT